MEQPELGRKISELRKQNGVTQEELVARCNVTVRTIQRIEAGEVMPRTSTLRLIVEALGHDWTSFSKAFNKRETRTMEESDSGSPAVNPQDGTMEPDMKLTRDLQMAWIGGIIYFITGFPEAALEWDIIETGSALTGTWFYVVKAVTLVSFIFFIRGYILLASRSKSTLLAFASWIFLFITITDYSIDLFSTADHLGSYDRQLGKSLMYGCAAVLFGVALYKTSRVLGSAAHYAGLLEMVIGIAFLTFVLFPVGLVLMIPAELLEIYLLFRVSESQRPVNTQI